ncbi:MAG: DUF2157 domain-containing protein [Planctomycetia bacterium]|nr:DUF2157 domain-containing protein [Planctomycetia bacterium]
MSKSILSHPHRAWLQGELDLWCNRGLISTDQAERILDLYESPVEIAERQKSVALFVLVGLAAALIGLAALLLVGYNWSALPDAFKVALIFGSVVGVHAAGFYMRYRTAWRLTAEVVFFLGCVLYGAGLGLMGQILHLNSHFPDGLWWWALGVLPFALLLDTVLLHILLTAVLAIWVGVEVIGFPHLGAWLFGRWRFLPNLGLSLPLLTLPGLIWAYRKGSAAAVALYAPLLAWWLLLLPLAFHREFYPIYLIGAVGGLFLLLAQSHPAGSRFAIPYRLYGILIAGGMLVPLSFHQVNKELARDPHLFAGIIQTGGILLGTGAALAAGVWWRRRDDTEGNPYQDELRDLVSRQWLPVCVLLLMAFLSSWNVLFGQIADRDVTAIVPTLLANAALVASAFWLMRVGLHEDRGAPFAAGVASFLLWTVLRYIDLFGDVGGILGASCLFFLCGMALLGVALYWRRRKEIHHAV